MVIKYMSWLRGFDENDKPFVFRLLLIEQPPEIMV